jgi:regulator of sirC expression with transglutaminase-like and TPR domain
VDPRPIKARLHALITGVDPLPLDVSCLLICQLAGRDIDVEEERKALDMVAETLDATTFEGVIAGLFAGPQPLRGNTDAYYDITNSLLSDVRRTGLGIPISLSVLAMEIGRRKDVPIVGIGMPGHFLVGDGSIERGPDRFADPFHGVRIFGADGARELFQRFSGGAAAWSEAYLQVTSNIDILFRIVNNIRVACTKRFVDRQHLPWVLEVLSWFPQGQPFDQAAAARAVAPFN